MKEILRMLGIMTAFCVVSGFVLAWTNSVTRAPIAEARQKEALDGLKRVLPPCDNDVVADAKTVQHGEVEWKFYVAKQAGAFAGAAFESEAAGYGGPIKVLVGISADDVVRAVEILAAERETPGLGTKVKGSDFLGRFAAKSARDAAWAAVAKDGGAIQGITGATVSSRAVAKAVKAGLNAYAEHADEIKAGAGSAAPATN